MAQTDAVFDPIRGEQAAPPLATPIDAVKLSNCRRRLSNLDLRRSAVVVLAAAHYAQWLEIRAAFAEFLDIRQPVLALSRRLFP